MRPTGNPTVSTAALDYDSTMISALELRKWVFAVQLPGVNKHTRHVLAPNGAALVELIERLKARSKAAGLPIARVIVTHEAGRDGFWLARFLQRRGIEVHVMQSSSLPVDRRARRAKTDVIDVEMLLRTLMAWRRDRRKQLDVLRQPDGDPVPPLARARIERLLDRLELVLKLIAEVETARDAVLDKASPANEAERMICSLAELRSIGPDFATLLVREAFVREFRNRRALAGYAGLGGTPFSSGGSEREQGIGKDGNRRLRATMVELAWMWLRWQPGSDLSGWFRMRTGQAGSRTKKI